MTVKEAAARLGLDDKTVYRLCQRGELAHHRYGRRVVVHEADLVAFIARHRVDRAPAPSAPRPATTRHAADGRAVMEAARRRARELLRG